HGDRLAGHVATHHSPGAVRAGAECVRISAPASDVRARAHRTGNDPHDAALRVHRALAGQEPGPAEVLLARDVIVVTVDLLAGDDQALWSIDVEHRTDRVEHVSEHQQPVLPGVALSPFGVRHVVPGKPGPDAQKAELRVRQPNAFVLQLQLRFAGEEAAALFAHASTN